MTTKNERTMMLEKIKLAMKWIEEAEESISCAREVMRDAAALIDAMSDELAELRESA